MLNSVNVTVLASLFNANNNMPQHCLLLLLLLPPPAL